MARLQGGSSIEPRGLVQPGSNLSNAGLRGSNPREQKPGIKRLIADGYE